MRNEGGICHGIGSVLWLRLHKQDSIEKENCHTYFESSDGARAFFDRKKKKQGHVNNEQAICHTELMSMTDVLKQWNSMKSPSCSSVLL